MTTTRKNYDIARLRALDVAHHLPAQANYGEIARMGGSRIITRAQGCTITDGDGNDILDGMAGLWCVNVGYGRSELADVAREQMLELPFYNTFFKTATPPAVELAAKVSSLTGDALPHVFFNNSGSEANDTVMRLVRHYWDLQGQPQRKTFISRWNAYHGSTVAGVSLGGMKAMHKQGDFPIPGVVHAMQPYWFNEGFAEDPDAFGLRAAAAIEQAIVDVGPENVAAFIAEPVQGAGGVIIPPGSYWPAVQAIVQKYGILLVCDEVICGFGRLGHWFGHQYYGLQPDIISMAKGLSSGYLPISATAVSAPIVEVLRSKGSDFVHGYTYSGHPTCAAVALKNIEIMEREDLVGRTRDVTAPVFARMIARVGAHELVGQARCIGLLGALEIVSRPGTNQRFGGAEGKAGPILRDLCIAGGLMVRAIRDSIVMCPPLIISDAEIERMGDILLDALDKAAPRLRALNDGA